MRKHAIVLGLLASLLLIVLLAETLSTGFSPSGAVLAVAPDPAARISDPAGEETAFEGISAKLGYCPTMEGRARLLESAWGLEAVGFETASQTLGALAAGEIDIALIGRMATDGETGAEVGHLRLEDGYTLISDQKRLVDYASLAGMTIHTSLPEDVARGLMPDANLIFYGSFQDAVSSGIHEAVLIDWDDYNGEYGLLIPMLGGKKVEKFRVPVLYYAMSDGMSEDYINYIGGALK